MQEKTLSEHFQDARNLIKEASERKGEPEYPTGISFLDNLTGGIHKGEVWVISGKTGGGKTSLALQMARNCADKNHTILFLTLEMRGWELTLRMYCEMMNKDFSQLLTGKIAIDPISEHSFMEYISKIDFEIIEFGYTFEEIEKVIETHYKDIKPDIIFIDFIQLIDYSEFNEQRLALVSYIRKIKEMANKMDIGFVIVSQIRRLPSGADYNRPPDLQDLMGSGSIEQTADKCLFIYKQTDETGVKYFINLAKNRQGRTQQGEVKFIGESYRFEDIIKPTFDNPELIQAKETFEGTFVERTAE